jgi:uncharacterized protein (DUF58 family)
VDRSASMGYGSHTITKYDYACKLAAAIGYVVVKARDAVGLYLYSAKLDYANGARNSFVHLNNLLKTLQQQPPATTTQTAPTLHLIAEAIHRRALIVLISDLFDTPADVVKALAHFRKQRHDVVVFHVLDPMEVDFSFKHGGEFEDMETGECLVADPRTLAADYQAAFSAFLESYRKPCAELNIDYRLVNTREPPDVFVRAYLDERRKLSR